jgi:malate synthase
LNATEVKAGTRFARELFQKLWDCHNEWTLELFAEMDRHGDPGRMDLLKRQLLSPRYIQHSARVLFVVAQANQQERADSGGDL